MIGEPKLDQREEQPYVGIRTEATMVELSTVIPQLIGEIFDWSAQHGLCPPAGAPFVRYNVIDMAAKLDIEIGLPVAAGATGDDRVSAGELPAGRYASLVYRGNDNGIQGNWTLIKWVQENGLALDSWDTDRGDAFAGRYESFLTDPADDPNPDNWDTEVAMKLVDK